MRIKTVNMDIVREPMIRPFGFKGCYLTEKWLCKVTLESRSDIRAVGLGGLAVLWSDRTVFLNHSEVGGNLIMASMLEYALQASRDVDFETPVELLETLLPSVHAYGQKITGNMDLKKTFTLNSMVALDTAAWVLYAKEKRLSDFDIMIPEEYRSTLCCHHKMLASIPLFSYKVTLEEIEQMVKKGYFFLKIKIGASGDSEQMLASDMARIQSIHHRIGSYCTPHTPNGKICYYLDANGRYPSKRYLMKLLDHAEKIGMLDQIAIIEEPFPEHLAVEVGDLGVRIAADESLHTTEDIKVKADLGYGCLALKPAGKTLSLTLKMAKLAREIQMPCFVADSTCPPAIVNWNKNVAARVESFPGLDFGLLESNAHQHYTNWAKLAAEHPYAGADWQKTIQGVFQLDEDFYQTSGGIFFDDQVFATS